MIHSDIGPILLGNFYRPLHAGEVSSINRMETEWLRLQSQFTGTILLGDFNVHHLRWLQFSSGTSVEGTTLWRFCIDHGFRQMVTGPTRGKYLLDLVLTDLDEIMETSIHPIIADYCLIRSLWQLSTPILQFR